MYYAEFCAPLKSRATATIYRLYLSVIELLPIWTMFIDRIIVRIWFSVVTLSIELLNLAQIDPYCRVVVECGSLLSAQNSVIQRYPQCRRLVLYGNTIYSVRGILFNGIKPRQNHTAADVFLNYLRYFTMIKSSPISDMRPIGERLIKRKVFAGAHTI